MPEIVFVDGRKFTGLAAGLLLILNAPMLLLQMCQDHYTITWRGKTWNR
jgi:hypothetical protein